MRDNSGKEPQREGKNESGIENWLTLNTLVRCGSYAQLNEDEKVAGNGREWTRDGREIVQRADYYVLVATMGVALLLVVNKNKRLCKESSGAEAGKQAGESPF